MQRYLWDLHYAPPQGVPRNYPISAIYMDTPSEPLGPSVMPGQYTVKLTAGSQTLTQTFTVKMDPRVQISAADLAQQFDLSIKMYDGNRQAREIIDEARKMGEKIKTLQEGGAKGALGEAVDAFNQKMTSLVG